MADSDSIKIKYGSSFELVTRVEDDTLVYKAISAITQGAPVRLTVTAHAMPPDWRGAITNVAGMTELNATANAVTDDDYKVFTVVDPNTLEINAINAAGFSAYVSGGILQYYAPFGLADHTGRLGIKARPGLAPVLMKCTAAGTSGSVKPTGAGSDGSVIWQLAASGTPAYEWRPETAYQLDDVVDLTDLLLLSTSNGRLAIDSTNYRITATLTAAETRLATWRRGWASLELTSAAGKVTEIFQRPVVVESEVTT